MEKKILDLNHYRAPQTKTSIEDTNIIISIPTVGEYGKLISKDTHESFKKKKSSFQRMKRDCCVLTFAKIVTLARNTLETLPI